MSTQPEPTAITQDRLAELVRLHQAGLWRYLRFLGCDRSQADDLVQEVFLAVWRKGFEDRGTAATSAYLRITARNLFVSSIRRAERDPVIDHAELADDVWVQFAAEDGGNAWLDALRDCVSPLEGRSRAVIDGHYRENRSRAELAEQLEMTEDGVKSLLRRTRDLLRKCVAGKLQGEAP